MNDLLDALYKKIEDIESILEVEESLDRREILITELDKWNAKLEKFLY